LDDPDFELKIRKRDPKDFDEAVRLAQRYEVARATVDGGTNARYGATILVVGTAGYRRRIDNVFC